MRRTRRTPDRLLVGAVVGLGILAAALAGAAAADGSVLMLGALCWLALVVLGLRYPALPFAVALVPYVLASANNSDNTLLKGAEAVHGTVAGPLAPTDTLMVAAAVAAVAALARMPAERRSLAWSQLAAPVAALLAAGLVSGLVVHREGGGAVFALFPLIRLGTFFAIASILLAAGELKRGHVAIGGIVAAEVVGALGVYNSIGGGSTNTITETTLPGGEVAVDERTLAFVDAAGPFVIVFGLAAILTRGLWSSSRDRVVMVLLGVIPFIGLVLSVRRAMWIDFAIASVVIVLVSASVNRRVLLTAVVALSVGGVIFVTLTQNSPAYQERLGGITTVFSSNSSEANIRSRQIETEAVWRNIREHPVEGIGLTEPYLSNVQFQYQEPTYLHNNVLWVWLKFGILGLIALLWLVWRTARAGLAQAAGLVRSRRFTDAETSLAASATMLGFFVASLTASFLTASVRPPVIAGVLLAVAGFGAAHVSASRPLEASGANALAHPAEK
jgi:hypothetical protein